MSAELQTSALDTLTAWHSRLVDVTSLGGTLCRAIEGDDLVTAISTMMQLRRARMEVARVEPSTRGLDGVDVDALRTVRNAVVECNGVHAVMHEWLARTLPSDADLLTSALGVAVLADAMLPVAWDFERDLVVLLGDELAPVASLLADIGQRRLVFVGQAGFPDGIVAVQSVEEMVIAIHTMTPMAPQQMTLRASESVDLDLVKRCAEAGRDALADLRIHQNTVRTFSRTWIEQGAANLPHLARWPTVDGVGDALAGVPMVIVAPGPSLANNVAQLRDLQGRAVITCFSHSLKPLAAAGIKPDLIISVDAQDVRYHFAGCDTSASYLVNGGTVHPALYGLPARGALTLPSNGPLDSWLFEALGATPNVVGGGSVATTAFSLALHWRCDPIVFIGLDLSFPGGKYYVSTSSDGDARAEVDGAGKMHIAGWSNGFTAMKAAGGPAAVPERVVKLPGWRGDTVPSSFSLAMFHRWFVETMRGGVDSTVYNCTEGGAFIKGMHHVPFAEVIPLCTAPIEVRAILDRAIGSTNAGARRADLARHLAMQASGLRRARTLATHAMKLAAMPDRERDLQRTERALARALAPLELASLLAQREIDRAFDVAAHQSDHAEYLAASMKLFTIVIDVVDQLVPILNAAKSAVEKAIQ